MRLSLIIPAYNEENAVEPVIEEYYPYVEEIIIVDDGSTDNTYKNAKKKEDVKVRVFRHEVNKGKVAALRTGVTYATGDIIIFTDADCTYPARYIPDFIDKIRGGKELVLGSRLEGKGNIPLFNRLGNSIFSLLAGYISCQTINDAQTGFRAFRREIFKIIDVDAKGLEYETKMTVNAAKLGYGIAEVPIEYRERVGYSKLHPFSDGIKMFFALLSVAWHQASPLAKMIILPSFILTAIGFGFGLVSIYERLTVYYLENAYFPLISVFFILLGIQLLSFGLIIDYITKKLDRIEGRLIK